MQCSFASKSCSFVDGQSTFLSAECNLSYCSSGICAALSGKKTCILITFIASSPVFTDDINEGLCFKFTFERDYNYAKKGEWVLVREMKYTGEIVITHNVERAEKKPEFQCCTFSKQNVTVHGEAQKQDAKIAISVALTQKDE